MELTFKHIEQVMTLHQYGSFRRAADVLCISQPALSRSVSTLEEKLGVKVFDRTRGGLVPTRYGEIILKRGERVLKELALLERDVSMVHGGEKGIISLGCGPFPAEVLAGEAIGRFNRTYPKMSVKLMVDHSSRLTTLLRRRVIDFFVADAFPLEEASEEFEATPLPQQQGYFCCGTSHPLAALPCPTIEDIFAFPLALMWVPSRILHLLSTLLKRDIRSLEDIGNGLVQCDSLNVLLKIVASGEAFTITSRELMEQTRFKEQLCFLPLTVPEMTTNYAIISLRESTSIPAIHHLRELFVQVAEDVVYKEGA